MYLTVVLFSCTKLSGATVTSLAVYGETVRHEFEAVSTLSAWLILAVIMLGLVMIFVGCFGIFSMLRENLRLIRLVSPTNYCQHCHQF